MKNLKEMKIDELVKLYRTEENEEMRSLVLVQIVKKWKDTFVPIYQERTNSCYPVNTKKM